MKMSMREMMAQAKADKAEAHRQRTKVAAETGYYDYDGSNKKETDAYFEQMKELKEKRYGEKQEGLEHSE